MASKWKFVDEARMVTARQKIIRALSGADALLRYPLTGSNLSATGLIASASNQFKRRRLQGGRRTRRAFELAEHAFDVRAHRAGTQLQRLRDLLVTGPQADVTKHLRFTRRQQRALSRAGFNPNSAAVILVMFIRDQRTDSIGIEAPCRRLLTQQCCGIFGGKGLTPGTLRAQRDPGSRGSKHLAFTSNALARRSPKIARAVHPLIGKRSNLRFASEAADLLARPCSPVRDQPHFLPGCRGQTTRRIPYRIRDSCASHAVDQTGEIHAALCLLTQAQARAARGRCFGHAP